MNPHGTPASHSRQGPHAADIEPFFESAAELRLSLAFNSGDYDFATSGGRIIYLVDANVVCFFLNPEEERYRMHVFGPGRPTTMPVRQCSSRPSSCSPVGLPVRATAPP